ncbi:MAG: hypothetical protein ACOYLH_11380 [Flavobacteriales bacterium]
MSSHENKQPGSAMLWIIIPAAFLLALYFIGQNDKTVGNKERLSGAVPVSEKKVEMVVHHEEGDTTGHAIDTSGQVESTPHGEMHAAPAGEMHDAPAHH